MFNSIESTVIDNIKDELFMNSETAQFIISPDTNHKSLANNNCSVYIDAVSNNGEYILYENNLSIRNKGVIRFFISGMVKTKITKDKSLINLTKFEYANYIVRTLETITINNITINVFDTYTIKYKINLANAEITYGFDFGDGRADFGINFQANYILTN